MAHYSISCVKVLAATRYKLKLFSIPNYSLISSSLAFWAQTQNRMTNFSLTEAGTMCSLPEELMVERSIWFSSSLPIRRKHTSPT